MPLSLQNILASYVDELKKIYGNALNTSFYLGLIYPSNTFHVGEAFSIPDTLYQSQRFSTPCVENCMKVFKKISTHILTVLTNGAIRTIARR